MKKINIIKKNKDYSNIINFGKHERINEVAVYYIKNTEETTKFGFSTSKNFYNAVTRNKIKRQIKNIVDQNNYKNGYNCIIMIKKGFDEKSFVEKKQMIEKILTKIGIIEGIK